MALVLHFIKKGNKAIGMKLVDDKGKDLVSALVADYSKFEMPWSRLFHFILNWRKRVHPKELLLLPQKQVEYLNSLTVLGCLYPNMLEKGYKTSLFFDPMMLSETPFPDSIQISENHYFTVFA